MTETNNRDEVEKIRVHLVSDMGWFIQEWNERKRLVDRSDLVRRLAESITDKFRIIPREDDLEKYVEEVGNQGLVTIKLKWRK